MKKRKRLLIALLVFLVPAIGFGYKFFSWDDAQSISEQAMTVAGEITVKEISPSNKLLPGDKMCDKVSFNINSTAVSLLRVKVDSYYSDTENGEKQKKEVCYLNDTDDSKWIKGEDGYYYYKEGVSNTTVPFVDNMYFDIPENEEANEYQGKYIHANITAEMVQAKHGVFKEKWGIKESHSAYAALEKISNDQGE